MNTIIAGKKILVAEDNELNKFILLNYLKNWNAHSDYAINGEQAIDYFKKNSYDLILMDMEMPGIDGIEATKIIRSMPKGLKVPIIALSASDFDDIREEVFSAGINEIISKPFQKESLKRNIIKILEKYTS